MHTNVILTNKRRTHAQSNYTNTKLKATFRRLLRHPARKWSGSILHPRTHTEEKCWLKTNRPFPENDLKDGVGSGRVHVCGRDAGRADVVSVLDQPEDVLDAADLLLLESDHLHLLLGVLQHTQLLLPVQQVKHLTDTTCRVNMYTKTKVVWRKAESQLLV